MAKEIKVTADKIYKREKGYSKLKIVSRNSFFDTYFFFYYSWSYI